MARNVQEPTMTKNGSETRYEHPAFGQIVVNKVSGQTTLYGSDFVHHNYISLTIKRSTLVRRLSHDSHFDNDELIRVSMSEAQWATFVSSFGVGGGVPCTLERVQGQSVPGLPVRKSTNDFANEGAASITKCEKHLADLISVLNEETTKLPKKTRDTIIEKVRLAQRAINDELPFIKESFEEFMEETVERAKVETHAYMNSTIQRAGLQALTNGKPPIQIED